MHLNEGCPDVQWEKIARVVYFFFKGPCHSFFIQIKNGKNIERFYTARLNVVKKVRGILAFTPRSGLYFIPCLYKNIYLESARRLPMEQIHLFSLQKGQSSSKKFLECKIPNFLKIQATHVIQTHRN